MFGMGHPGSGARRTQSLVPRVRPPYRQRVPLNHILLDQESIASILADLRGQVSSLQGLASDLQGEKGKVSWWQSPRGLRGCWGRVLGRKGATEGPPCWDSTGGHALTLPPLLFPGQAAGGCAWKAGGGWS